jgi:DNA-binding GntR family transcriptional regulator
VTPEAIADLIRQAIREKVFAPGAALIQEDLANRFGVSRSPVREALRMVAAEGLVVMQLGEGATVRKLSKEDLEEIYDLRIALEPLIAQQVVDEARARDIATLADLVDRMSKASTSEEWLRHNFDFHRAIYQLTGRVRTESILTGLLSAVQPYSEENISQLGGRAQADIEHAQMIDAIRRADAPRLSDLLIQHIRAAKERLAKAYKDADSPDPLRMLRR